MPRVSSFLSLPDSSEDWTKTAAAVVSGGAGDPGSACRGGAWGRETGDLLLGAPTPGAAGCTQPRRVNPPRGSGVGGGARGVRTPRQVLPPPARRPPGVPAPLSGASQSTESSAPQVPAAAAGAQSLGHAQPCAPPPSNYIMVPPARCAAARPPLLLRPASAAPREY